MCSENACDPNPTPKAQPRRTHPHRHCAKSASRAGLCTRFRAQPASWGRLARVSAPGAIAGAASARAVSHRVASPRAPPRSSSCFLPPYSSLRLAGVSLLGPTRDFSSPSSFLTRPPLESRILVFFVFFFFTPWVHLRDLTLFLPRPLPALRAEAPASPTALRWSLVLSTLVRTRVRVAVSSSIGLGRRSPSPVPVVPLPHPTLRPNPPSSRLLAHVRTREKKTTDQKRACANGRMDGSGARRATRSQPSSGCALRPLFCRSLRHSLAPRRVAARQISIAAASAVGIQRFGRPGQSDAANCSATDLASQPIPPGWRHEPRC